jgi:ATP-binding cassette, subfamily B, bacterial
MTKATAVIKRFWRYASGNRWPLLVGGVAMLVVAGCELATVIVFSAITNHVLATARLAAFWRLAACWLAVVAVAAVAMFFAEYLTSLASERFALRLRDDLVEHAQRLSPDFFDTRNLGDLMIRLTDDVAVIEGVACSGALGVVTSAVSVVLFTAAALVVSWPLALVAGAVAPVFWVASHGFSGRMARAAERERALTGRLTSAIEETLANQSLVQAFSQETTEFRRLHAEGDSWLRARMAQIRLGAIYAPAVYLVETLCVLAVFGFGAWELARGAITLGGLLAFAILLAYLYPPVQGLAGYRLAVSAAAESVSRVTEILDARPAVPDRAAVRARVRGRGVVVFDQVSFAYPESGRPVVRGLSFRARPGELVAITGPSGSGKSTVAKLLLRFYDADAGRILLDGVDVTDLSLRALRYNITLLQQESLLFSGTIADNIGYGKRDATPAEIVAAARAADAHEFVTALPDGYQTLVGQRGRLISGGQRQRIAIARATLRDSPVLVLDEPTAGLSPTDARLLMGLLGPVMAGRTTIVITHDVAIAAEADHVVTLEPGRRPVPHA